MKKVFVAVLLIFCSRVQAQTSDTARTHLYNDNGEPSQIGGHVYHVNFWGSLGITVGAELAILSVQQLAKSFNPEISNAEFDLIQSPTGRSQLNPIDRWALDIGRPSRNYTYIAVDYQTLCALAPLALLFGERYRKNWDDIILLMAEVNAIDMFTFQFSPFGPFFQKRIRPEAYYAFTPAEREKAKVGSNRVSFYSGHTSAAAASLFLMAKIYCDYNTQIQGWEKVGIYALASVPVLGMGYLRLIALRHFPSDIIVGGIVGGTIGIVVPELHRIIPKNVSLGMYSSPASTGMNLTWNLK